MRVSIPPGKVASAICKSWEIGLSLSSLPELLGISKPTFYKLLKELRGEGFEIRLMPNLQALGYNAFLAKGSLAAFSKSIYALDPASMSRVSLVYAEVRASALLSDLLRMIGIEALGPFSVKLLVCPTGEVFEAKRLHPGRVTREEKDVVKEVSESFLGIKDISKKLGMSWQTVTGVIRSAKSKGLLLGPIIYWKPSRNLNMLGVIIEIERSPPPSLLRAFISSSSIVVLESIKDFTHLIVGVAPPRKLIEIIDEYGSVINKVYLAPDYPLQSLKSGSMTLDLIKDGVGGGFAKEVMARIGARKQ